MNIFIIICLTSTSLGLTYSLYERRHPSFPRGCLVQCGSNEQIGMIAKNKRCIPWRRSAFSNTTDKILENTTFCVNGNHGRWCGINKTKNSLDWEYCDKEECKFINTTDRNCFQPIELSTSHSSIYITSLLCYAENCLVVTYSSTNECFLTSRCTSNCTKINDYTQWFFSFCHVEPHIDKETPNIIISSLAPNTSYRIYVLPITDSGDIGMVTRLNVITRPTTMPLPSRIDLANATSTSMRLKWTPPSDLGVPPGIYRFQLELFNGTYNYLKDDVLQNLDPCRVYCFRIRAFHYTEHYYTSGDTCFTTAPGGLPQVGDIRVTKNYVEWSFREGFTCPVLFEGLYHEMSGEYRFTTFQTEEKHINLSDLVPKTELTEYRLHVRACFKGQDKNSLPGQCLHWVSFHSPVAVKGRIIRFLFWIPLSLLLLIAAALIYTKRATICGKDHVPHRLDMRGKHSTTTNIQKFVELKMEGSSSNSILIDDDGLRTPPVTDQAHKTSQSIEDFSMSYDSKSEDDYRLIKVEYKKICEKALQQRKLHNISKNEIKASKSKLPNILPHFYNKVALKGNPSPNNHINGSYISYPSDPTRIEYIASRGPVAATVGDFWTMIWDEDVNCIVMLIDSLESRKLNCVQYWPSVEQSSLLFGKDSKFTVVLIVEDQRGDYIRRTFQVSNKVTNETRKIIQVHMVSWNDFSAPDLKAFEIFLFAFHELSFETSKPPYLVHCSTDVGQTGTFIAIDRIVRKLAAGHRDVDIFGEVLEISIKRNMMVQRQAHYVFIYEFIHYFLGKYCQITAVGAEIHIYSND